MAEADASETMAALVHGWLAERSEKELVEIFHRVFEARLDGLPSEASERLTIAQVSAAGNAGWDVSLVALDDPDEYPDGWAKDAPLCQYATCNECGWDMVSWAKHALCPVCGEKVYCT